MVLQNSLNMKQKLTPELAEHYKSGVLYDKDYQVVYVKCLTPELARIVAHICGDGYVLIYNKRRNEKELAIHPRINKIRKIYSIRYVNKEDALVKQFVHDVKKEFDRKVVSLKKHEHEVSGKRIYSLLTYLGAAKSFTWFISEHIINASDNIRIEWLKAFFDDESHVSLRNKRIVLNMVNKKGLEQVQALLKDFDIKSTLNGPYKCRQFFSYHLNIYRTSVREYAKSIGFYHPKKRKYLQIMINSLKK